MSAVSDSGPDVDVLVVGAGPAGLTTALQAHAHGASVRVVERRPEPFRPSRAMVMHPRALESLRPLGVTAALLDRADTAPRAELHLGSRRVSARLADVALGDTAFPHLTLIRQMDVEEVLTAALRHRGVQVERGVELVDAQTTAAGLARATLSADGRAVEASCRFLAGCDGPASTVRGISGVPWQGGPYRQEVVLADAELGGDLAEGVLHVAAGRQGLVFVFALGERATWRILATRPARDGDVPFGQPGPPVAETEIQQLLDDSGLGVAISDLVWSAHVPLQHRLAGAFRQGPLFLVGDAAHAHSPAAAQGMNSGILDAANLGWKLGFASRGEGRHLELLDSYDQERRPVARQVLALTHLVFFAEASTSPLPAFLRGTLVPLTAPAVPLLLRQRPLMAQVVRVLSQRWVHYRHSVLSVQAPHAADRPPGARRSGPGPRPGDRVPDQDVTCEGRRLRLHELTARPGVHVLLARDAEGLEGLAPRAQVAVHRVSSWPGRGLVALRPDGHVGLRCGTDGGAALAAWLDLAGAR
jgi:2-polyprenyl-6-methoxyphenol hydroxylase-like FAD-dependent oxidoreductase